MPVRDAIYVDFEAPKTTPPSPAILGILTDRAGRVAFEQVVLDPRLAAAAVARSHVRIATLADTVSRLTAAGLPIVGWSVFDRDLVMQADLDDALKTAWEASYVNALPIARTWRTKVHPKFHVTRASEHDAKHTLDQYATVAGYAGVARLKRGQPAKWIRHLLQQLAARQHYRRVTRETKRDWHDLLRYNEEDCRALRHVYLRAVDELTKWRKYESSDYFVLDDRREVRFRVGSRSARLAALLDRFGARRWAFLTAWNPGSRPLSRADNDTRQNALLDRLMTDGYRVVNAEGRSADGSWCEESVFALDIPESAACAIGRDFGQLTIVVGSGGDLARLVSCV